MSAESISAFVSAVGVAVAIGIAVAESRRARFSQGVSLIRDLDAQFESAAFRLTRAAGAKYLLAPDDTQVDAEAELRALLNFYENIGMLMRRGAIDAELVWHHFGGWLIPTLFKADFYIRRHQIVDSTCYKEIKPLYKKMLEIEKTQRGEQSVGKMIEDTSVMHLLSAESRLTQLSP